MELVEAKEKVESIVKENKYMLQIPIKEVSDELRKFCKDNDIEKGDAEYAIIMNMMKQEMKYWFDFRLELEFLSGGKVSGIPPEDFDNL